MERLVYSESSLGYMRFHASQIQNLDNLRVKEPSGHQAPSLLSIKR